MAQLYYRYSTMNAGKSIELIKVAYNYEERGKHVLTLIPAIDDRYGMGVITSRIGIQREAMIVNDDTNILELFMRENEKHPIDCVLMYRSWWKSWTAAGFPCWPTDLKTISETSSSRAHTICSYMQIRLKKSRLYAGADVRLPWLPELWTASL